MFVGAYTHTHAHARHTKPHVTNNNEQASVFSSVWMKMGRTEAEKKKKKKKRKKKTAAAINHARVSDLCVDECYAVLIDL